MRRVRSGVAAVFGLLALFGAFGVGEAAAAPPFVGQTYAKAAETIEAKGLTATIATVIGSQLPTDDCRVTKAYMSFTLDSSGRKAHKGTWMLDLNCNQLVAEPGKPGGSTATSEGKNAKKIESWIAIWNVHPEKCDNAGSYCRKQCDYYGGCSDELLKYLAGLA